MRKENETKKMTTHHKRNTHKTCEKLLNSSVMRGNRNIHTEWAPNRVEEEKVIFKCDTLNTPSEGEGRWEVEWWLLGAVGLLW